MATGAPPELPISALPQGRGEDEGKGGKGGHVLSDIKEISRSAMTGLLLFLCHLAVFSRGIGTRPNVYDLSFDQGVRLH